MLPYNTIIYYTRISTYNMGFYQLPENKKKSKKEEEGRKKKAQERDLGINIRGFFLFLYVSSQCF